MPFIMINVKVPNMSEICITYRLFKKTGKPRGSLQWLTSITEDWPPTYEVTNVGLGKAKSFYENFFNIKLFQLIKYQDQNLTLSDIDGQERKKERKSEVQKFDNLEDKRILFILIAKIKIVGTIFNSCNKI